MNAAAMKELIHQTPFEPFELILSSGDRYPVRHPEFVLILQNRVLVGVDPKGPRNLPNSYVTISYLHIAAADPLPQTKKKRRTA